MNSPRPSVDDAHHEARIVRRVVLHLEALHEARYFGDALLAQLRGDDDLAVVLVF